MPLHILLIVFTTGKFNSFGACIYVTTILFDSNGMSLEEVFINVYKSMCVSWGSILLQHSDFLFLTSCCLFL